MTRRQTLVNKQKTLLPYTTLCRSVYLMFKREKRRKNDPEANFVTQSQPKNTGEWDSWATELVGEGQSVQCWRSKVRAGTGVSCQTWIWSACKVTEPHWSLVRSRKKETERESQEKSNTLGIRSQYAWSVVSHSCLWDTRWLPLWLLLTWYAWEQLG